jgi:hypothetical protein
MKSLRKAAKGAKQVSTSEVRKQLAAALRTVKQDKVLIGFGRYGDCVALLAPVEAAYLLAGRGAEVRPELRAKIKALAEAFADGLAVDKAPAAKTAVKKAAKKVAKKARPKSRRGR